MITISTLATEQSATDTAGKTALLSIAADGTRLLPNSTYKLVCTVIMRADGRDEADKTTISTSAYSWNATVNVAGDGSLSIAGQSPAELRHEASTGPDDVLDRVSPTLEISDGALVVYGVHPKALHGVSVHWGAILQGVSLQATVAEGTEP